MVGSLSSFSHKTDPSQLKLGVEMGPCGVAGVAGYEK